MKRVLPVVTAALLLEAMGTRISYCRDCDEFETNAILPAGDMTDCYCSYLGHQDYREEGCLLITYTV